MVGTSTTSRSSSAGAAEVQPRWRAIRRRVSAAPVTPTNELTTGSVHRTVTTQPISVTRGEYSVAEKA